MIASMPLLIFQATPLLADLGGADLNSVEEYTSSRKYDALCGRDKDDCVVTFKDGRISVDGGIGIRKDQIIQIFKRTVCRRGTSLFGASMCHNSYGPVVSTMDKEFILTYQSTEGAKKRGMITFLHQRTSDDFQIELEEWSGAPLRVVGPSVTID